MVFKRKKKEEPVPKPIETETIKAEVNKEEPTPEQKRLKEMVDEYNEEYNGIFNSANMQDQTNNLLFGILQELKQIKELIKEEE